MNKYFYQARLLYQDRLGTNILGKAALKKRSSTQKEMRRFLTYSADRDCGLEQRSVQPYNRCETSTIESIYIVLDIGTLSIYIDYTIYLDR